MQKQWKNILPRISPFFKLLLNHIEFEKIVDIWKMRIFTSFPTPSHLLNSDKPLSPKYDSRFRFWKKWYFQNCSWIIIFFAKTNYKIVMWISRAFQRYITCPVSTKKIAKSFELKKTIFNNNRKHQFNRSIFINSTAWFHQYK